MVDLRGDPAHFRTTFEANFRLHDEAGASASWWVGDTEICSLSDGWRDRDGFLPWDDLTIVPLWSATKGPAAACVLTALHERGLGPETPVGDVWPGLGRGEVARQPIGSVLSHQGGLCALDTVVPVTDHEAVAAALEAQRPLWPPGTAHGYHPRTFGFLAEELVRRTAGMTLGDFWKKRFAVPLDLELWIGLPPEEDDRVAEMLPPRAVAPSGAGNDEFYRALGHRESLTARAFSSPQGLGTISHINRPETRRLSLAGFGGIGNARSLARFYAVLASGGVARGHPVVPPQVCRWAETTLTEGPDRVLLAPTAFAAGFMKDVTGEKVRRFGPSPRAFGHPGAGGSHAFGDPEHGIGFAYVMNQMHRSVFPTEKALALVRALYGTETRP